MNLKIEKAVDRYGTGVRSRQVWMMSIMRAADSGERWGFM